MTKEIRRKQIGSKEQGTEIGLFSFPFFPFLFPFPLVILVSSFVILGAAARADDDEQQAFRAAVERVAPSVVRIETVGGLEQGGSMLRGTGPTTGLILSSDGLIVSSAFNFAHRPASILVQLPGGQRKPARLVARDHSRMLVLLRVEAGRPLPVPEFAPESEMRVGQWTIAVGRTFEAQQPNLAIGILSAVGRVWGKAVQTDAAVSPDNYGGPLVDLLGRVLGVLVPLSPQGTGEMAGVEWYDSGIGFAIPAESILRVLPRWKAGKDLEPGQLGIELAGGGLYTAEPIVSGVRRNSPADRAGLRKGDRIVEISGRKITRAAQAKEEIVRRYAGDKIRVVVARGGKSIACEIELVASLPP
jgi:serine protease Do